MTSLWRSAVVRGGGEGGMWNGENGSQEWRRKRAPAGGEQRAGNRTSRNVTLVRLVTKQYSYFVGKGT